MAVALPVPAADLCSPAGSVPQPDDSGPAFAASLVVSAQLAVSAVRAVVVHPVAAAAELGVRISVPAACPYFPARLACLPFRASLVFLPSALAGRQWRC